MDAAEIQKIADALGFDPALLGHAATSIPIFAAFLKGAKLLEVVPRRFELLAALALTVIADASVAIGAGTAQVFPAVSSAAVGAVLAMVIHASVFKKDAPDPEPKAEIKE